MDNQARETVIDSLRGLSSYYQSRYEHYLAMATEAKENFERVELLMLDLGRDVPYLKHESLDNKRVNASQGQQPHSGQSQLQVTSNFYGGKEPEIVSASIEVNELPQSIVKETKVEDKLDNSQSLQLKQLLQNLSQAMSAIEIKSKLDSGKSLHKSYLHQILNRELSQELSLSTVDLYLDEAVNRGLIKGDEFNNQCYIAVTSSSDSTHNFTQGNGHNGKLEEQQVSQLFESKKEQYKKNRQKSSTMAKRHGNLPPSPQLKPTLLETIEQYIGECSPNRFLAEDVIDYLYLVEQRAKWSRGKTRKVRVSISNVLSRKAYLDKYWKRVEPGIYEPL